MAKRFTDSEKYKKSFMRGLTIEQKVLWDYINLECDNAGVWEVELDIAGMRLTRKGDPPIDFNCVEILKAFKGKIHVFDNDSKWFIPTFISFQYPGTLNPNNNAHKSVIEKLKNRGLMDHDCNFTYNKEEKKEVLISPLQGAMDKDKEKDMVKEENFEILNFVTFESLAENFFKTNKALISQPDRQAIVEIGQKLTIKLDSKNPQLIFEKFEAMYSNLEKDEKWWKNKRKNLSFLNTNFEEAYSVAFDQSPSKSNQSFKTSKLKRREA